MKTQKRIRVCFAIPNFLSGGAERNLVAVANGLDKSLFEVYVLCLSSEGPNYLKLNLDEVTVVSVEQPRIYFSILKIVRAVKRIRPDVIVSWMGYLNAYLIFFHRLFPKTITWICRESSIPSIVNRTYYKLPWLFSWLYRYYGRYRAIICQSQFMADDLVQNFGLQPEKLKVIHNPAGATFQSTWLPDKPAGQAGFQLLYVGRLSAEKRVHLLLHLMAKLPPQYHLTIVGNGSHLADIRQQIETFDLTKRVNIVTDCTDPSGYYVTADCLLLCSAFEGFPNVVVEALTSGCPAIGFNILGGAAEALQTYGGFFVAESDIDVLRHTVMEVCERLQLDRSQISKIANNKYSLEHIILQYQAIFSTSANRHGGRRNVPVP